jgi:outer membrane protein TolC
MVLCNRYQTIKIFPVVRFVKRTGKLLLALLIFLSFQGDGTSATVPDSILSFESAAKIALQKNFDIIIADNELTKAKNMNHAGQAGMLPDLNAGAGYSRADNTTRQRYSNGDEIDRSGAVTENLNAEVVLGWTIFDGLRMFSTKRKLSEIASLGETAFKMRMEEVYLQVSSAYYSIIRQQQLIRNLKEDEALARERLTITERRMQNGSGSRLDYLHAKTDLNARLSEIRNQETILESYRIELNRLLTLPPASVYLVEDSVRLSYTITFEELKNKSMESNQERNYYRQQLLISELELKESSAGRWPQIRLSGSYNYSNTENEAGFIRLNKFQGMSYGVSASLPVFNGLRISREIKNARLDVVNARLASQQVEEAINADLLLAFNKFEEQKSILKIEEENILAATEILQISQERFRSGISSILELKEVQRGFENAVTRLVNARYEAKMAENNLKKLAGELINDFN